MTEVVGNLWNFIGESPIVITTNGDVNRLGKAVMGRGVALQANRRFQNLSTELAISLRVHGNHVTYFNYEKGIYSFPVKHHWNEKADIELIRRSCVELLEYKFKHCYLPRPGCGNGGLLWSNVKPEIEKILDDRVTIINLA